MRGKTGAACRRRDTLLLTHQLVAQFERERNTRLPLLTPEYLSDIPGFARRFFRVFFSCFPARSTLVLDNCHEVTDANFHQVLVEATQEVLRSSTNTEIAVMVYLSTQVRCDVVHAVLHALFSEVGAISDLRRSRSEAPLRLIHLTPAPLSNR
jgi:hypothetical protein